MNKNKKKRKFKFKVRMINKINYLLIHINAIKKVILIKRHSYKGY
jgi:hypothetical protein